ncbi:phage holin [Niallia taxi]|uniref:phage holin n=1 Tax=Niallia taxi TaxID=2499688 RepID=UPI0031763A4B
MDKMMIIRTIVLVVALINQSLVLAGFSPLPFDDTQVENGVTMVFTVVASLWAYWKDNDVTRKAREAKTKPKETE